MENFIGIDPGLGGGIAHLGRDGRVLGAYKMPGTERDVLDVFDQVLSMGGTQARAVLEFVRSSPQMGVASAFKFGAGYGALRMALAALHVPFDEVVPRKWQAALQCLTGGDKNVSKRRAQELFPLETVTHATSDALLLAEYARRLEVRRP